MHTSTYQDVPTLVLAVFAWAAAAVASARRRSCPARRLQKTGHAHGAWRPHLMLALVLVRALPGQAHVANFNFEQPLGMGTMSGWSSPGALEGALKWDWGGAFTFTANTGPSSAHSGTSLCSTEATPWKPGVVFELFYDGFACEGVGTSRVTFWYSMYGTTMGTLRLRSDSGAVAWSRSGDQGDGWSAAAAVYLQSASFSFEGVRGSGYASDMAIDDVSVDCGVLAPAPSRPAPPLSPPAPSSLPPPALCVTSTLATHQRNTEPNHHSTKAHSTHAIIHHANTPPHGHNNATTDQTHHSHMRRAPQVPGGEEYFGLPLPDVRPSLVRLSYALRATHNTLLVTTRHSPHAHTPHAHTPHAHMPHATHHVHHPYSPPLLTPKNARCCAHECWPPPSRTLTATPPPFCRVGLLCAVSVRWPLCWPYSRWPQPSPPRDIAPGQLGGCGKQGTLTALGFRIRC